MNITKTNNSAKTNSTRNKTANLQLQKLAYNWARKQSLKKCTVIGSLILR